MEAFFANYGMKVAMWGLVIVALATAAGALVALFVGAIHLAKMQTRRARNKARPVLTDRDFARAFQKAYAFMVRIEGFSSTGFSKVTGLFWDRCCPGFGGSLVLTRGLENKPGNSDMREWFKLCDERGVAIDLLNRDGERKGSIDLGKCRPVRYFLSDLSCDTEESVSESLGITPGADMPEIRIGA